LNVVETRRVAVDTCSWLTHQVVLSKSIRILFLTTFISVRTTVCCSKYPQPYKGNLKYSSVSGRFKGPHIESFLLLSAGRTIGIRGPHPSGRTLPWATARPIAVYRRTQRSSLQLAYELAATWRWPTLAQRNHSELSHMAGAVDDSTIVVVIIIIIIITNLLL